MNTVKINGKNINSYWIYHFQGFDYTEKGISLNANVWIDV